MLKKKEFWIGFILAYAIAYFHGSVLSKGKAKRGGLGR